jgi:hypothetical protein
VGSGNATRVLSLILGVEVKYGTEGPSLGAIRGMENVAAETTIRARASALSYRLWHAQARHRPSNRTAQLWSSLGDPSGTNALGDILKCVEFRAIRNRDGHRSTARDDHEVVEHVESGSRDPEETITRLVAVLGTQELADAVARFERGLGLRLVKQ